MSQTLPNAANEGHPAAEDKLRLQSIAIENAVHQLRGLLVSGGYAKVLLEEANAALTPVQRDYLRTIADNTQRMKAVLESLSHAARFRHLELIRFDLQELLREIRIACDSHPTIRWTWGATASCARPLCGDWQKLRKVLLSIALADGWSGDGQIAVITDLYAEKRFTSITLSGAFAPMRGSVAGNVQGALLFAESRDILFLHGGSLLIHAESGTCEVTIRLPLFLDGVSYA